jgi:hypothetical protein
MIIIIINEIENFDEYLQDLYHHHHHQDPMLN